MRSLENLRAAAAAREEAEKRAKAELDAKNEVEYQARQKANEARAAREERRRQEKEQATKFLDLSAFPDLADEYSRLSSQESDMEIIVKRDTSESMFVRPEKINVKKWILSDFLNEQRVDTYSTHFYLPYRPSESVSYLTLAWEQQQIGPFTRPVGFVIEADHTGKIRLIARETRIIDFKAWEGDIELQQDAFGFALQNPVGLFGKRKMDYYDDGSSRYIEGPGSLL